MPIKIQLQHSNSKQSSINLNSFNLIYTKYPRGIFPHHNQGESYYNYFHILIPASKNSRAVPAYFSWSLGALCSRELEECATIKKKLRLLPLLTFPRYSFFSGLSEIKNVELGVLFHYFSQYAIPMTNFEKILVFWSRFFYSLINLDFWHFTFFLLQFWRDLPFYIFQKFILRKVMSICL